MSQTAPFPLLWCSDVAAIADWATATLGLDEVWRVDGEAGAVAHAELTWKGGRISLNERAEQYEKREYTDSFAYHLVRAKLRVMLERDPEKAVEKFEHELEAREYANVQATAYGWALALSAAGQHDQAAEVLGQLMESYPNVVAFRAALAENSLAANRVNEALALYSEGYELYPDNRVLVQGYARALLRARQPKVALEVIDDYALGAAVDDERIRDPEGAAHRAAPAGSKLQRGVERLSAEHEPTDVRARHVEWVRRVPGPRARGAGSQRNQRQDESEGGNAHSNFVRTLGVEVRKMMKCVT